MRLTIVRCLLGAVSIVMIASVAHAAGKATVRGAEAVNVRRGPSADSAAFATVSRGSAVKVQRVVDGWALITLDSGQPGYIKAEFLDLPPGIEVVTTQPTAVGPMPTETPSEGPAEPTLGPASALTPEVRAEGGRGGGLEREVAQLRDRLAAVESAISTPAAGSTPIARSEADEPAVEEGDIGTGAPTHVGGALLPTVVRSREPQEIGPSVALAGLGLIVGLVIGAAYGRRQERNRRSRVRF